MVDDGDDVLGRGEGWMIRARVHDPFDLRHSLFLVGDAGRGLSGDGLPDGTLFLKSIVVMTGLDNFVVRRSQVAPRRQEMVSTDVSRRAASLGAVLRRLAPICGRRRSSIAAGYDDDARRRRRL